MFVRKIYFFPSVEVVSRWDESGRQSGFVMGQMGVSAMCISTVVFLELGGVVLDSLVQPGQGIGYMGWMGMGGVFKQCAYLSLFPG